MQYCITRHKTLFLTTVTLYNFIKLGVGWMGGGGAWHVLVAFHVKSLHSVIKSFVSI